MDRAWEVVEIDLVTVSPGGSLILPYYYLVPGSLALTSFFGFHGSGTTGFKLLGLARQS